MEFREIYNRLRELSIPYEELHHVAVYTCEEAERLAGHEWTGKTKNLFLRNKNGSQHYLLVLSSQDQVRLRHLAEYLGEEKLSFASKKRLEKYLRQKPGCVSPLGLIYDAQQHVKVLVQEKVLEAERLSFHPNLNTVSLIFESEGLIKYLDSVAAEWQKISRI